MYQKISCVPDQKEFAFCLENVISIYSFQMHHGKKLQIKDESIESEYLYILDSNGQEYIMKKKLNENSGD